ncbi:uncharacterized protein AB675_6926 [Cyphellophora attinorum]|uniref:WSC domain-containing protein n=1 Tax=Cyphellophora attinorum TaxID=1664694 RepID=A0A0N1H8G4_9EURO|nr:uncharacterized protein AB675_6926 [Phialophora attinorum]KPI43277.1 hypothetical protein AB675_6926 [Phialophora attinorum]
MRDLLPLALLLAAPTHAFWRLPCPAPLTIERLDPIVSPGKVSAHAHTILGGNGLASNMTYNTTQASTCSSCTVIGDNSNYWVPALYFQHKNGSFESVKQNGGALVYYLQRAPKGVSMKAFPPNFRMVAGDPFRRSDQNDTEQSAISYACIDYNAPGTPETHAFPTRNCPNGLRQQVFFPSCWDGVNEDSPDHTSHVAYPVGGYNGGKCPDTHPVNLISVFIEILWQTDKFKDFWNPDDKNHPQPFVFAHGDPTGYGGHGDFLNGWDIPLLQRAIDTCTSNSGNVEDCKEFKLRPDKQAEGCVLENNHVDEVVTGVLPRLPGCNDVTPGPDRAPLPSGPPTCGATTTLSNKTGTAASQPSIDGWKYVGCGTDSTSARAMTAARSASDDMTNAKCASFCSDGAANKQGKGFKYFGTQYARECYCADEVRKEAMPIEGVPGTCKMACSGDGSQMCGGYGVLSIWQRAGGDDGVTKGKSRKRFEEHVARHAVKARKIAS